MYLLNLILIIVLFQTFFLLCFYLFLISRGGAGGGGGAVDGGINELKVDLGMIIKNRKGKNKAAAEEQ